MYIGIDLGGTNIAAGVVDENGKILHKDSVKTHKERNYVEIIRDMAELSKKVTLDAGLQLSDIEWVGVGSPGTADSDNGVLVYTNNLNFSNTPMREEFQKTWNVPLYIANDADAAAYGEAMAGGAVDAKDSIMITLGTGVGGGIIIDNKIYNGFNHAGAELGHMTIVVDGEQCTCGNKGCLEAYASASALIRQTKEVMDKNPDSLMWKCLEDGEITGKTSFDAAHMGDEAANFVVDRYIKYIAIGITNFILIFQPEVLLIGGGICAQGDYLLNPIKEYVKAHDYNKTGKNTEIAIAKLGNDAGIIGAAFLGKQFVTEG